MNSQLSVDIYKNLNYVHLFALQCIRLIYKLFSFYSKNRNKDTRYNLYNKYYPVISILIDEQNLFVIIVIIIIIIFY